MEDDLDYNNGVTVNLFIYKDIIDKLVEQSDVSYDSLNSIVNQILKRYIEWNKFIDNSNLVSVTSPVAKELFDCLDKEEVIKLAKDKAKDAIYNIILFMNGKVNFEIFLTWYMQRMKQNSGTSFKKDGKGNWKIIFKHDLGEKWSLFHRTILESICHDILSVPIKVNITDSTIIIEN